MHALREKFDHLMLAAGIIDSSDLRRLSAGGFAPGGPKLTPEMEMDVIPDAGPRDGRTEIMAGES